MAKCIPVLSCPLKMECFTMCHGFNASIIDLVRLFEKMSKPAQDGRILAKDGVITNNLFKWPKIHGSWKPPGAGDSCCSGTDFPGGSLLGRFFNPKIQCYKNKLAIFMQFTMNLRDTKTSKISKLDSFVRFCGRQNLMFCTSFEFLPPNKLQKSCYQVVVRLEAIQIQTLFCIF